MLPFDKALNPNEAYVGIRYAANDSFVYTAGASLDELGGPGGLNYRLIAGIRYTVFDDKKMAPRPIAMNPNQNPTQMPARPVMNSGGAIIATAPHAVMRLKRIEISTPINFENNSYQLMPDSKQTLDDVASLLKKNQNSYKMILVDGHTSGAGNDAYNLKLSLARARSVKSYLISQGIPASALEARGFGNRSPKVSPKAKNADAINRRVEFLILK
jgi:outer membrane protein OmpA-like peptidoglycan-associated protein